jgi:hypothetical protein
LEAICSSETSVDTQRTTRRYIPEVDTLHNDRCENLKSYNKIIENVLNENEDNVEADGEENDVTDTRKEKPVKHKGVTSSFSARLKWAEKNEIPIQQMLLLRQLRDQACKTQR